MVSSGPSAAASNSSSVTGGASSSPPAAACAVCKYQRRKCNPDCALAKFFPADAQEDFKNAHNLFGVKNILKILEQVDPADRGTAVRTIIYESNARRGRPVGGCYQIICQLQDGIQFATEQLGYLHSQIAACQAIHTNQHHQQQQQLLMHNADTDADESSAADMGMFASNPHNYMYFEDGGVGGNDNGVNQNGINFHFLHHELNDGGEASAVVDGGVSEFMPMPNMQKLEEGGDEAKPLDSMFLKEAFVDDNEATCSGGDDSLGSFGSDFGTKLQIIKQEQGGPTSDECVPETADYSATFTPFF